MTRGVAALRPRFAQYSRGGVMAPGTRRCGPGTCHRRLRDRNAVGPGDVRSSAPWVRGTCAHRDQGGTS